MKQSLTTIYHTCRVGLCQILQSYEPIYQILFGVQTLYSVLLIR